jgi:phosphonate transport system substrate-binding protein
LQQRLGIPIKLYPAADYAGVMQAMAAGQLDLSEFSPSAFAGAWLDCKCVEPTVVPQEKDGTIFYIAVMVTRKDSGITSLAQMKGHSLAWADPNSASGYLILRAQGIDLSDGAFFSRTGFAGGHEQGIIAVINKQYDAAVTWTSGQGDIAQGYSRGALRGMVDRGMLNMSDVNIIWKSGKIPNGPWGLRSALPASLKTAFTDFMLDLPKSHKDVYDAIEQGSGVGYQRATLDLYKDNIDLRENERRGGR